MNTSKIWTDRDRCCGKPCIRNTRFSVAQLIAEIADGRTVEEVAYDFRLNFTDVRMVLEQIALYFDRSWENGPPGLDGLMKDLSPSETRGRYDPFAAYETK